MFDNAPLRTRPAHLRWRVVPVPAGEVVCGWLCGPQVTVDVHWEGGASKPCRHLLTKGKVLCSCETEPRSVRTIGYVPIYTPEREQLVIIVSATVAEAMADFPFGHPIEFIRSRKSRTPLRVKSSADGRFNKSSTEAFMRNQKPRDIKRYLVHLWQDPLLSAYFDTLADSETIERKVNNTSTALPDADVSGDLADVGKTPLPKLSAARPHRNGKPVG